MRRWIAALALAGAWPRAAEAQLVVDGEVEGCPDEGELRAEVERRLGRDPFLDEGTWAHVTFAGTARVTARVELVDEAAPRRFEAPSCRSVARAVALLLSVSLARRPLATPVLLRPQARMPLPVTPPPRPEDPSRAVSAAAGASVVGHVGVLPGPGTGVAAHTLVAFGPMSMLFELRWHAPVRAPLAGGEIVATMLSGTTGPCLQRGRLTACGIVTAGRLSAHGEGFDMSSAVDLPYLSGGARLGAQASLGRWLSAGIFVEGLATVSRSRLVVTGAPAGEWSAPPVAGAAGFTLVGRLF